jgi:hypothetical protein
LELPFLLLYSAGELDFQSLMVTANEHRNVWPRLISLAFYALNGHQWDPQLPMLVNAASAAAILVLTAVFLTRGLGDRQKLFLAGAVLLIGLQPWDWFSVVWGIQMLSYLLVLLSVTGMALVALHPPRAPLFWLGLFLLLNAHLTMGSGFAAAACAAVLFGWRALVLPGEESRRPNLIKCGLCVIVASLVIFSRASTALETESAGLGEFLIALAQHLAFPYSLHLGTHGLTWLGLLMPLPVLLLGLLYLAGLRGEIPGRPRVELCLLLAGWLLLQFITMAWFRGSGGEGPALRHLQIHQVWLVVCLGALVWCGVLLKRLPGMRRGPRAALWQRFAVTLYLALSAAGGALLTAQTVEYLRERDSANTIRLRNVRNFLATGDAEPLLKERWPRVPWKDNAQLASILSDPRVQRILPAVVRSPLALPPPAQEDATFSPDNLPRDMAAAARVTFYGSYRPDGAPLHPGAAIFGPLSTEFSHLEIWVAGDLEDPEISLLLSSVDRKHVSRFEPVAPQSPLPIYAGDTWKRYQARVPASTFALVATDHSEEGWITFSEPFEINRLSVWGAAVRQNWLNALFTGFFFLFWAVSGLLASPRERDAVAK